MNNEMELLLNIEEKSELIEYFKYNSINGSGFTYEEFPKYFIFRTYNENKQEKLLDIQRYTELHNDTNSDVEDEAKKKHWFPRARSDPNVVVNIFLSSTIKNIELYSLRLLWKYTEGATSFADLKTIHKADGTSEQFNSFRETALYLNLLEDTFTILRSMNDAITLFTNPNQIIEYFGMILCATSTTEDVKQLFDHFKSHMGYNVHLETMMLHFHLIK